MPHHLGKRLLFNPRAPRVLRSAERSETDHGPNYGTSGFTLIEVSLVIVLIVIMSAYAVSRFDALDVWRQRTSIRKFVNTWEFLYQQAQARGESYRLVVNFDKRAYFVRREVPVQNEARTVDLVANLRLDSEKQRQQQKKDQLLSLDEEFQQEDDRQNETLENLYFGMLFRDPEGSYRLGIPLEFPSMKNETTLTDGIGFRDIVIGGEKKDSGEVAIRFTSRGTSEFAVVHFRSQDQIFTAFVNPATGRVTLENGDHDFDDRMSKRGS